MAGTATLVDIDDITQGSWIGIYGADGFALPSINSGVQTNIPSSIPGYATVVQVIGSAYDWIGAEVNGGTAAPTTGNPKAIQHPDHVTNRFIVAMFAGAEEPFVQVSVGETTRRIAVYVFDPDNTREVYFRVTDGGSTLYQDSVSITGPARWYVLDITGTVYLTQFLASGPNILVTAVMFDTPGGGGSDGEGSGIAALGLDAIGRGYKNSYGSGSAALNLSAQGVGYALHSGSGEAALDLDAIGAGYKNSYGSGIAALALGGTGSGYTETSGSGAASLTLDAIGAGYAVHYGSGIALLNLGAEGSGEAPPVDEASGSGIAHLILGAVGVGHTPHYGSGIAFLNLSAQGRGEGGQVAYPEMELTLDLTFTLSATIGFDIRDATLRFSGLDITLDHT